MEQVTDIKRIITHGEKACAYMADGYARACGRPGVAMAQKVGAANLAAGLQDPFLGCSPVIALTGGPYTWSRGRNFYQEIEDFPLFQSATKFSAQVTDANRLPDLLRQAFRAATVGKPGPVHLELAGHAGEVIEDQEFAAEVPETDVVKVPPLRVCAEAAAIERALGALRAAQRPVIVAGGGVRASGAGPEMTALAERLGIPVATSLNGKDTILGDHPLNIGVAGRYARPSANQVIMEADLVFYIGSQTGSQVTLNWQVPPTTTRTLQLDIDPAELGRHYPHSVSLFCDAKTGLAQLLTALNEEDRPVSAGWTHRAQEMVQRWRNHERPRMESDQVPIRPERLCSELSQSMPEDALLVSDTGHAGMWTGGYVDLRFPHQGYIRAAGSLGWGLPAALGAQLGQPDRPVILFTGDGGLWYHVAELETAGRWQIPLVIVVNNNRSLNQEIDPMREAYGGTLHGRHSELWHFADLDLAAMAETMGVQGITVRKASDFRGALEKALASTGPALINVVTDIEALAPPGNAELPNSVA
jgi:acetolactate synthase-1/2/3 large subunit